MTARLFLVDQPFVSDFVRASIAHHRLPLVLTEEARRLGFEPAEHTLTEDEAVRRVENAVEAGERLLVYTVSENAIGWVARHLGATPVPGWIDAFKDKARFRRLLAPLAPGFVFREVPLAELASFDPSEMPLPFIVKPSVGFFSLGVHRVAAREDWGATVATIHQEMDRVRGLYPEEVLATATFVLEECIEGEELAVDAYFDAEGRPVVLGLLKHAFASEADTGDRLYTTSKEIVETYLEEVTESLARIGERVGVRDIPVHAELRRRDDGLILPIEINPARFGAWCTTADLTYRAFGFDPYAAYFAQERPDWERLLDGRDGTRHSIIVLDNSTGVDPRRIASFDHDRLLEWFARPLELRRVDHRRYQVFGFLFVETPPDRVDELDRVLHSDLSELITVEA